VYKSLATYAPLPCVDQDAIAVRRHQQFGVPLKPPNLKEGGRRKEEEGRRRKKEGGRRKYTCKYHIRHVSFEPNTHL
jgi:hypothetical protein